MEIKQGRETKKEGEPKPSLNLWLLHPILILFSSMLHCNPLLSPSKAPVSCNPQRQTKGVHQGTAPTRDHEDLDSSLTGGIEEVMHLILPNGVVEKNLSSGGYLLALPPSVVGPAGSLAVGEFALPLLLPFYSDASVPLEISVCYGCMLLSFCWMYISSCRTY